VVRKSLVAITVCSILSLPLVGCGNTNSPHGTVEAFVESLKEQQFDKSATYWKDGNPDAVKNYGQNDVAQKLLAAVMKKDNIEVTDEQIDGDKATVKVKVTGPDLRPILGDMMVQAMASVLSGQNQTARQDLLFQSMISKVNASDCPMTDTETTVTLEKVGDQWKLSGTNQEFLDALIGHMQEWATSFNGK
jgi:hypothetical protein